MKSNIPTIPTTIGEELKTNIFLRYDNNDIKQALNLKILHRSRNFFQNCEN